jgi:hypothetical protein
MRRIRKIITMSKYLFGSAKPSFDYSVILFKLSRVFRIKIKKKIIYINTRTESGECQMEKS